MKLNRILLLMAGVACLLSGCSASNNPDVADVQGTWRGPVSITTCSPADICSQSGFVPGTTVTGILTLTQDKRQLDGTYSYEGVSISAPVSGQVGSNVVALNGVATNPLGSVTVNISGSVTGNNMVATITHQITLTDGRAADISATGTLSR